MVNLEALHVLAADVDDKVHVGQEMPGRSKVGHGLHHAVIRVESVLGQILTIASGSHRGNMQGGMLLVKLLKHFPDQGDGVSQVGPVVGKQQPRLLVNHRQLYRGGAGVNADMYRRAVVRPKGDPRHSGLCVAGMEGLIFLPVCKQRRMTPIGLRGAMKPQPVCYSRKIKLLIGIIGRAQRHKQKTVLRTNSPDSQRVVKALPQAAGEGQRPAQIQHLPADRPALGQPCDGLIHHRLINAGGNVWCLSTLVDEGLNIALGKDAASGSNGIGLFRFLCSDVHLIGPHF